MFQLIKFFSVLSFTTAAVFINNETISRIYNQPVYTPRKSIPNEFDFTGYKNYTVGVLMASNLST